MRHISVLLLLLTGLLLFEGCGGGYHGKVDNTPYATRSCNKALNRGQEFDPAHAIDRIVVYKKKRRLYIYRKGKKVGEFRISLGKNGDKGDKISAGDYRTPEGHYRIVRKKCDPRLYRSLMISYPDSRDRREAAKRGVNPGGYITIHGQPKWNADGRGDRYTLAHDWTEGCIAVSNATMDLLWQGVRNGVKIEIYA